MGLGDGTAHLDSASGGDQWDGLSHQAGMLSGAFYVQSFFLFASTGLMLAYPPMAHIIFGVLRPFPFFVPGLKYYRQSLSESGKLD